MFRIFEVGKRTFLPLFVEARSVRFSDDACVHTHGYRSKTVEENTHTNVNFQSQRVEPFKPNHGKGNRKQTLAQEGKPNSMKEGSPTYPMQGWSRTPLRLVFSSWPPAPSCCSGDHGTSLVDGRGDHVYALEHRHRWRSKQTKIRVALIEFEGSS